MLKILFIITATLRSFAADGTPEWITNPPTEDFKYKYYVGYSDGAQNETKALEAAYNDAVDEAIRENFGFTTNFNHEGVLTENSESTKKHISQISGDIQMNGFEKVKIWTMRTNDKEFSARILFRYSKLSIKAELRRQETSQSNIKNEFTIQGLPNPLMGNIEISSTPQGAKVFIDGEPYAITPIFIQGQLARGFHQVRLEHPQFENKIINLEIIPGVTKIIREVLTPARGDLEIISNPKSAEIYIDGKFQGITPTIVTGLIAGKKYSVELEHPDTIPVTLSDISIEKQETNSLNVELTYRTKMILFESEPENASVYIDGSFRGNTPYKAELEIREHSVNLELAGYSQYSTSVDLNSSQTKRIFATLEKKPDRLIESASYDEDYLQQDDYENKFETYKQDMPFHLAISYNSIRGGSTDSNITGYRNGNLFSFDLYFEKWGITKTVGALSNSSEKSLTGLYLSSDGTVDKTQLWSWFPSAENTYNKIALGIGVELEKYSYSYYAINSLGVHEKIQTNTSGFGFCFGGNYFVNRALILTTRMGFVGHTGGSKTDETLQRSQSSFYFSFGMGLNLF